MESIKQEIINNIYENGEQLITGPILQEVLLDMVDDVNDKVASASAAIPGDLVEKTGSWDDAADWVEQNSSSVVLQPDLDGYATEQWVEDQGYLKEVPEGYATTESLNDLSESVAQSIADIPEPDLSNYVTKPELNEATESVKEWVEAKHYLTTASLSGSVTEETVGFMINDATASVKDWVESQSYATEQWVEEQGYLKEHQDISGLATTESVTSLSESVAQDFANLNIPDVSGLATTESVNQLSESIAQTIEDLPQVDLSGYVTTASYNTDSASFDQRINDIPVIDPSGYVTTQSYNLDSASFDERINAISGSDLSGYATTESLNQLSESFSESIPDVSGFATTASVNQLSESIAQELETKVDDEGVYNILAGTGLAEPEYGEWIVYEAAKKDELLETSSSLSASIAAVSGSDLSGYATTSSVNALSESVSSDSASFDQRINGINIPDVSIYATTASLNSVSESLSASIASITSSGGPVDLSGYATTASLISTTDPSNSAALLLETLKEAQWDENQGWVIPGVVSEGEGDFWETAPAILRYFYEFGLVDYVQEYEEGGETPSSWYISYNLGNAEWGDNPIMHLLRFVSSGSGEGNTLVEWEQLSESDGTWYSPISRDFYGYEGNPGVSASFVELSESVASMPGVDPVWVRGEGSSSAVLSGSNSIATGKSAVAEGSLTSASGISSHAEGTRAKASGSYSHAEGYNTIAAGSSSHAEGTDTTASGHYSHAEGRSTITTNANEHAQGRFNATASGQIFSVGAGYNNSQRKNAISVLTSSDASVPSASVYIYGVGNYDGTNPQPGVNDVATLINAGGGSGADVELRSFLFGVASQTLTGITGSVTNIYSNISSDTTLGFNAVPDSGKSLGITIHNTGNSSVNVTLPATVTVGGTTYNLINNGVDSSGSMSIPSGEYGDIVVTRNGNDLFVRTSIDVSSISGSSTPVDLSGYATTASLQDDTDPDNSVAIFLNSIGLAQWDSDNNEWHYNLEDAVDSDPNDPFYMRLAWLGLVYWQEEPDPQWLPYGSFEDISKIIRDLDESGSFLVDQDDNYYLNAPTLSDFENASASFDQRISSLNVSGGLWIIGDDGTGAKLDPNSYCISGSVIAGFEGEGYGRYSFSEGGRTKAYGHYSHAEGGNTSASGDYSHAEGDQTKALGNCSHTEGSDTRAEGTMAHAEGGGTVAGGGCSHAEGSQTTAHGLYTHAEGRGTYAGGFAAHAEGRATRTANEAEHACGMYNMTQNSQIFSVGVGHYVSQDSQVRKNAISILTGSGELPSASVYVYGVGTYDGTNPTPGVNDLASILSRVSGSTYTVETWTFVLENSSSVTKNIVVA